MKEKNQQLRIKVQRIQRRKGIASYARYCITPRCCTGVNVVDDVEVDVLGAGGVIAFCLLPLICSGKIETWRVT